MTAKRKIAEAMFSKNEMSTRWLATVSYAWPLIVISGVLFLVALNQQSFLWIYALSGAVAGLAAVLSYLTFFAGSSAGLFLSGLLIVLSVGISSLFSPKVPSWIWIMNSAIGFFPTIGAGAMAVTHYLRRFIPEKTDGLR